MIPLSVPSLGENEKNYVTDALANGWVSTAGSYVTRFEKDMAAYLGVNQTVALQSGTAALHLAYLLAGILPGQEVIVPTLTFIAAINPLRYLGAVPVFMDCDSSLSIDCEKLEQFFTTQCEKTKQGLKNRQSGRIIKAVTAVHIFGNMADLITLRSLTDRFSLVLIEDASEALGTRYQKGIYKGCYAGTIGDFGIFSFNGNKIITTGGGGMLTAKDETLLNRARYLSTQAKDDPLNYVHNEIGYNYRMTNLQAALGVGQLECLEDFIKTKKKNYRHYRNAIQHMDQFLLLPFQKSARCNHWFYSLFIKNPDLKRNLLMNQLKEAKIQTRPIWKLNHTQVMYENCQTYQIEKAPFYQSRILNLPCSVDLKGEEIDQVTKTLRKINERKG